MSSETGNRVVTVRQATAISTVLFGLLASLYAGGARAHSDDLGGGDSSTVGDPVRGPYVEAILAQPIGTEETAEAVTCFLPYTSRRHVLIPPTITPTPNPTPTPYPPPEGFEARCVRSGALEICSWLPSGEPAAGGYVEASVRLLERDRPVEGAEMTVRWVFPYPTLFKRCEAHTGADGVATCGVDVPYAEGFTGAAQIGLPYGGWPYQRQIGFRIR